MECDNKFNFSCLSKVSFLLGACFLHFTKAERTRAGSMAPFAPAERQNYSVKGPIHFFLYFVKFPIFLPCNKLWSRICIHCT